MIVMKFGGSSVASGKHMLHVAKIVDSFSSDENVVVVVSAMKSVTDKLISVVEKHKSGQLADAHEDIRELYRIHNVALEELHISGDNYTFVSKYLLDLIGKLTAHVTQQKEMGPHDYDYVLSFGERFSSCLVAAALNDLGRKAKPVSASEVIVATNEYGNAKALIPETCIKAKKSLQPLLSKNIIPVVPGFFAATKDKVIVIFGRGGSDYTATVIANALDADRVILWKEVDGVYTADPKKDSSAQFYPELSYEEALSLAEKGAKILHPEAMKPVSSKGITVWVKNTFKPEFAGTKIWKGAN